MVQIIPSVLETSEDQYQNTLSKLSSCEALRNGWLHIDFADGDFVPNKTVGVDVVAKFPKDFKKETHLMVSHPKEWVDSLVEAGFERVIFHIESKDDASEVIDLIKSKGLEVGLALKNDTPIENLEPFIDKISVVLVMTIVPGFQGQLFIPETLDKIKQLRSKGWSVRVGIDGAVKDNNINEIVDAGVDFVIVGSYLLEGQIDENLEKLWEAIRG